jgi:hypothetical protein
VSELKESHGLILRELQDQLKDQDCSLKSYAIATQSQKSRLRELESTSELDDIDRQVLSAVSLGNGAGALQKPKQSVPDANTACEVQQWRDNCLQLQQKVCNLERTCGELRRGSIQSNMSTSTTRTGSLRLSQVIMVEEEHDQDQNTTEELVNASTNASVIVTQDAVAVVSEEEEYDDGQEQVEDDDDFQSTTGTQVGARSRLDSAVSIESILSASTQEDEGDQDQVTDLAQMIDALANNETMGSTRSSSNGTSEGNGNTNNNSGDEGDVHELWC